jgi:hypothetical protein
MHCIDKWYVFVESSEHIMVIIIQTSWEWNIFIQVNNFIFIYSVFQTNKLCPICKERVRRRHLKSLYFAGPGVDWPMRTCWCNPSFV